MDKILEIREKALVKGEENLVFQEEKALAAARDLLDKMKSSTSIVEDRLHQINEALIHLRLVRNSGAAGNARQKILQALSQLVYYIGSENQPKVYALKGLLNEIRTTLDKLGATERSIKSALKGTPPKRLSAAAKKERAALEALATRMNNEIKRGRKYETEIEQKLRSIELIKLPALRRCIEEVGRQLNALPEPNFSRLNSEMHNATNEDKQIGADVKVIETDLNKLKNDLAALIKDLTAAGHIV